MSRNPVVAAGDRFGRLTVQVEREIRQFAAGRATYVRCICDCGGEVWSQGSNLRRGKTSCGCDRTWSSHIGVAGHKHPLVSAWAAMIARCHTSTDASFKNYGGRGIAVCNRWRFGDGALGGFDCFLLDMGAKPSPEHTIERKNNNKNYAPGNCVWADRRAQNRNKRSNRFLTLNGERRLLIDWCRDLGLPYFTAMRRLKLGWPDERILTEPIRKRSA